MRRKRLVLDISTLVSSRGAIRGIGRVVRELAEWAASHRNDVAMVFYDPTTEEFLSLRKQWMELLWQGLADIDTLRPGQHRSSAPVKDQLPLKEVAQWLHAPRRRAMVAFEGWRLSARSDFTRGWVERLQSLVLSEKLRGELWDTQGRRRTVIPLNMAYDHDNILGEGDVLILPGAPWTLIRPTRLAEIKEQYGVKLVFLCHDIIPLLLPNLYEDRTVSTFRNFIHAVASAADLIVYNSYCSQKDMHAYCETNYLTIGNSRVMRFGAKLLPPDSVPDRPSPFGLEKDRYALFVSFFERRKGHALLFSVWKQLLALGIPQAHRFKLAFVGFDTSRNPLMEEIESHPSAGDSLMILKGVDDDALATLYRNAAFCLYPSLYEGYGLPVIESFGYGKAVIASTGGALPEVVGNLSPCLDPLDEQAWLNALRLWIERPEARAPYEAAIRNHFRPTPWSEAAEEFFHLIDAELPPT